MSGALRRGLLGGAMGTLVLNAVTYADMALRGRPASQVPQETIEAAADRLEVEIPGNRSERDSRGEALGALAGIATGLSVGASVSLARAAGLRLSAVTGGVLTGLAAMAASDGSAAALGVTDPRDWSSRDWLADLAPHLAYGAVTHGVVRSLEDRDADEPEPARPSGRLLARAAATGLATGSRASLGLAVAAAVAEPSVPVRLMQTVAGMAVVSELVVDKHPATTSRLEIEGMAGRLSSGLVGGTALAGKENAVADLPLLVAAAGVAAGAFLGAWWRSGEVLPAPVAAVVEDAVALGLAGWAMRSGSGSDR